MSLRQLKFKPRLQPSAPKAEKVVEAVSSESTSDSSEICVKDSPNDIADTQNFIKQSKCSNSKNHKTNEKEAKKKVQNSAISVLPSGEKNDSSSNCINIPFKKVTDSSQVTFCDYNAPLANNKGKNNYVNDDDDNNPPDVYNGSPFCMNDSVLDLSKSSSVGHKSENNGRKSFVERYTSAVKKIEDKYNESGNNDCVVGSEVSPFDLLNFNSAPPSKKSKNKNNETYVVSEEATSHNKEGRGANNVKALDGEHALPFKKLNFKPKIKINGRNPRNQLKNELGALKSVTSTPEKLNKNVNHESQPVDSNEKLTSEKPKRTPLNSCDKKLARHNEVLLKIIDNENKLRAGGEVQPINYSEKRLNEGGPAFKSSEIPRPLKKRPFPEDIQESYKGCNGTSDVFIYGPKETSKKKESLVTKSSAVFGSKSIRSCNLSVPFKPQLTNRSKRPFASSTFGKMSSEAKQNFEKRFGNLKPNKHELTLLDTIFYNPSTNPMPKEDNGSLMQAIAKSNDEKHSSSSETTDKNKNSSLIKDNNELPVPQLKVSSDGKVTVAEESLVVPQTTGEISDDVELITRDKFIKKRKYRTRDGAPRPRSGWRITETIKFYRALHKIGADFDTMQQMFPNRTRASLKSKFKREEKIRGHLIDRVLSQPSEFDFNEAMASASLGLRTLLEETIATKGRNLVEKKNRKQSYPLLFNTKPRGKRSRKNQDEKDETNNIFIRSNIEYDNLKVTQFITYNSNNLENPIEINETISH